MPLADLLDEVAAAPPPLADPGPLVAGLRHELDTAARAATDGLDGDRLPLRVPKDRLAKVLGCERHLLATLDRGELHEPAVRGRVLDRLLHHHVHGGGAVRGPALAIAEGAFEAERDDELVAWLDANLDARERLAREADAFAERLDALGPVPGDWWPRCEDRLRVDLAGGRVVCAAQLDLVVGGSATGLPMVVLEAKSGRFGSEHRDGLYWYALLASFRHGVPPAAVVAWSAWDGATWCQPVTAGVLRAATARASAAMERIGELARGRAPAATACRSCGWCPVGDGCEARDPGAGQDIGEGDDGW